MVDKCQEFTAGTHSKKQARTSCGGSLNRRRGHWWVLSKKNPPLSSVKFNRAPAWEFFMRLLFHTASELKLFSSLRFYKWLTRSELRPCVLDINRIFSRSSLMILGRVKAHNRWLIFTLYMTRRATWGIIAFNEIYFHILHPFLFTQAD